MKRGRKTNRYKRIKKLLNSGGEDAKLGKELLLASMDELHPDEWYHLNTSAKSTYRLDYLDHLSTADIQKYLYDKREEERRALSESKKIDESKGS